MNNNIINVIKTIIDTKAINREIEVREGIKDICLNYLVMNSYTRSLLWKDNIPLENWNENGVSYSEYRGIPIAICEKLKDGEIDFV